MKRTTRFVASLLAGLMVVAALPAAAQTDTEPPASQERIEHGIDQLRERALEALDRRLVRGGKRGSPDVRPVGVAGAAHRPRGEGKIGVDPRRARGDRR